MITEVPRDFLCWSSALGETRVVHVCLGKFGPYKCDRESVRKCNNNDGDRFTDEAVNQLEEGTPHPQMRNYRHERGRVHMKVE